MQSSRGTPFYNASDPYKGCIVSFLVFARAVLLSLPTHSNMRASRKLVVDVPFTYTYCSILQVFNKFECTHDKCTVQPVEGFQNGNKKSIQQRIDLNGS